ncbi:MAG: Gfo/Idh/MocA family oxidoreductase [Pseudomonadota bacterium]
MSQALRVLAVGAGYFARFHHEAWQRLPQTELAGIVDANIDRAAAVGLPAFASLGDALKAGVPDIIDLIVPPEAHRALIGEALRAAPRAIICQKPFATSLEEAKALTQAAEAAGIPLIIHENFRFQPWYRALKTLLDDGSLGDFHQATFRLRTGDGQGPRAYLDRQPYFQTMPRLLIHETAVHWIDTFRYLLGPVTGVYADLRRMNPAIMGEDAGLVIFEFEDGRRAVFDGNRHLDHASENTRLTFGEGLFEGSKASVVLTGDGALHRRAFGAMATDEILAARNWPGFAGDCVYALQAHVVAALNGACGFENAARDYLFVREIEEAIYRSAAQERRIAL